MEALTEEQRERIRKNRERALEIRRKRILEEDKVEVVTTDTAVNDDNEKRCKQLSYDETNQIETDSINNLVNQATATTSSVITDVNNNSGTKRMKMNTGTINENETNIDELEDFEINASQYVTKNDAMKLYCLPEGTISVCKCIMEKKNPRNPSFTPMKLYSRSEIRQRAYKRYGGLSGLQAERTKRSQKQYEKDLQASKQLFK